MFGDFEDFDNMDEVEEEVVETINIKLGRLEGVEPLEIESGITVGEFKDAYCLNGKKLVSRTRGVLSDSDCLDTDEEIIFVSTSKDNG